MGFFQDHRTDSEGNPAGGCSSAIGMAITWQNGPMVVEGQLRAQNGAFLEDVMLAAIGRLEYLQSTKFKCDRNEVTLYHMRQALLSQRSRTEERKRQGIEGTHEI